LTYEAGTAITEHNWGAVVADALARVNWHRAVEDVAPFLERPSEINLINERTLQELLR